MLTKLTKDVRVLLYENQRLYQDYKDFKNEQQIKMNRLNAKYSDLELIIGSSEYRAKLDEVYANSNEMKYREAAMDAFHKKSKEMRGKIHKSIDDDFPPYDKLPHPMITCSLPWVWVCRPAIGNASSMKWR